MQLELRYYLFQVGGPLWLDPLHDQNFVSRLLCKVEEMQLGTLKRIHGVLNVVREELDCPLYYTLDRLVRIKRRKQIYYKIQSRIQ